MHADIDGALEVARIATGFTWSWTEDDLDPLAEALGWHITERRNRGATLTTPLQIGNPVGLVSSGDDEIKWVTAQVADCSNDPPKPPEAEFMAETFTELADRLTVTYGEPNMRISGDVPQVRWNLERVNIRLSNATDSLFLDFVNPAYQARMEAIPPMLEEYNYEV
jgi:hypothetical protein